MNISRKTLVWVGAVLVLLPPPAGAESKCVVHEWGTFTSLQDETGKAIGGINTDDEPVPPFVHRLADRSFLLRAGEIPVAFYQGAPSCHPDVTMRLETPVIYFHPPGSKANVQTASVSVKFRGGWLTEFYPDAATLATGFNAGDFSQFPHLFSSTESKLEWSRLKIGGDWPMTNTTAHVWTSPRAVQSASVQTSNGEGEKFLFYRGVGHINAPLRISRDPNSDELLFRSQLEKAHEPLAIDSSWLVDIRPSGKVAFRPLPPLRLDRDSRKVLAQIPAEFKSAEFSSGNREKLKASLQAALIANGLFADEALALLNTWELSYFKSAGLRVFFIVPRAWTDFYLPLEISPSAEVNRVMVGRIELVTPEQRASLHQLAGFSVAAIKAQAEQLHANLYSMPDEFNRQWALLDSGQKPLADSISVPSSYQLYLNLGRFRNALILDEAQRRPSETLSTFISTYRLAGYEPK